METEREGAPATAGPMPIIRIARDIKEIFREHSDRLHVFRHDEYAGFDIEHDGEKNVVTINYLVHDIVGDNPRVTKLGKIAFDLDDLLSLPSDPENFIVGQNAIANFVRYVIERDEQKQQLASIVNSIAGTK